MAYYPVVLEKKQPARENAYWVNLYLETYYLNYIEPIEDDFESIPDDPFYRDQITFYTRLQDELQVKKPPGFVHDIITSITRQWERYGFVPGETDWLMETIDHRRYLLFQ